MDLDIKKIKKLYLIENLSIRKICKKLKIPNGQRMRISNMLRNEGVQIRLGKVGLTVGSIIDAVCPTCKKIRKKKLKSHKMPSLDCVSCATLKSQKNNSRVGRGEGHYNWKGGININKQGYVVEYVMKTNKWFPMASNSGRYGGYILQHRLVMAKHLNRLLDPHELIHHIDGNKQNNSLSNLKLVDRKKHGTTYQDGYRSGYTDAMKANNKTWNGKEWVEG